MGAKGATAIAARKLTANHTLELSDVGKVLEADAATPVTVTIPAQASAAFPVGSVIELAQAGTGAMYVAPAAGVSLVSPGGKRKLSGQFSPASLRRRGGPGATQFSRPSALFSQSAANWLTAPYESKLNEVVADDATFITSAGNNNFIDFTMSAVGTPSDRTAGSHIVRFRARRASGDYVAALTVKLKQGGTVIRSSGVAYPLTDSFALYSFNLTAAEAGAITDYSALRLEISCYQDSTGTTPITVAVSWAELQVPGAADEWILGGDLSL